MNRQPRVRNCINFSKKIPWSHYKTPLMELKLNYFVIYTWINELSVILHSGRPVTFLFTPTPPSLHSRFFREFVPSALMAKFNFHNSNFLPTNFAFHFFQLAKINRNIYKKLPVISQQIKRVSEIDKSWASGSAQLFRCLPVDA